MTSFDLIIFDCDGVLVDSEIVAARVEAELLTAAGFEIEAEELAETYAGLTFREIMLHIEQRAAIPFQASLIEQAETLVDRRLAAEVRAIEGALEAVSAVTLPRCICSNSSSHRLEAMLNRTRLLPFFDGRIFSSRDTPTGKPKPAPDVFLHAAKTLGADPARTCVVEDSAPGVHGARAAGMRVIGFTGASHSFPGHADALIEAGAETAIRRWADFSAVLGALSEWTDV
jgi:HAD superfamily hydrolase (TIGR01509 family)